MFLIVGLGNPGKKYQNTRHNIGALVIEKLEPLDLPNVILAKPTTFMNESGKAVKKLVKSYLLNNATAEIRKELIVVHDDIDLSLGKIRIVKNRGAAGHKGVESIIKELGTKDFIRIRIGIKPQQYHRLVRSTEKFVLEKFKKSEEQIIEEVIKKTATAIEFFLKEGLEKTMNEFNK